MIFWALTDLRMCYSLHTLFVWAQTDEKVILILRWTTQDPLYPVSWPERRGIPHKAIEPTFPKEWRAIRQWEEAPTYEHTFSWTEWPDEVTQWFIFTAHRLVWEPASQIGVFQFTSPLPLLATWLFTDGFSTLPCARP